MTCVRALMALTCSLFACGLVMGQTTTIPRLPRQPGATKGQVDGADQRGTEQQPLVIRVNPAPRLAEDDARERKQQQDQAFDRKFNEGIAIFAGFTAFLQIVILGYQVRLLRKQSDILNEQNTTMSGQLAQATIAANAAQSSATEAKESNDLQKLVTELGNRAYVAVSFNRAIFQDANLRFEVEAALTVRGNTPAYDLEFKAAVDIVPFPIPDDFAFPLTEHDAGASSSFIAPGAPSKFIVRVLPNRVPDTDVNEIKYAGTRGGSKCLLMWGIVNYVDAFKRNRFVKFAFVAHWIPWVEGKGKDKDGNPIPEQQRSADTRHHNEAN